jgi:hypothetical protein
MRSLRRRLFAPDHATTGEPSEALDADLKKYRDWLIQADHDASRDYDAAVLTLATGTLALSVTFAHDIAPSPVGCSTALLGAAWFALTVSLVTVLWSLITSQASLRKTIDDIDQKRAISRHPGGTSARVTGWLNELTGACLVFGLVAFAVFALVNL